MFAKYIEFLTCIGLLMSQTNMAVLTGLQFPLTGVVTSLITGGERRRLASSEMVTAGFLGGALSGILHKFFSYGNKADYG